MFDGSMDGKIFTKELDNKTRNHYGKKIFGIRIAEVKFDGFRYGFGFCEYL